jgi:hypothetical protein
MLSRKAFAGLALCAILSSVGVLAPRSSHASSTLNAMVCTPLYNANVSRSTSGIQANDAGYTYLNCPLTRTSPTGSGANINVYITTHDTANWRYLYAYSVDAFGNYVDSKSAGWIPSYNGQTLGWTNNHVSTANWGTYAVLAYITQSDTLNSLSVTD